MSFFDRKNISKILLQLINSLLSRKYCRCEFSILTIHLLLTFLIGASLFINESYPNAKNYSTKKQNTINDLEKYYSRLPLGVITEKGKTTFRLFAPRALKVELHLFKQPEDKKSSSYQLEKDSDGVWSIVINKEFYGYYYAYKVFRTKKDLTSDVVLTLDPYAKAVTTFNNYLNPRRGIILKEEPYNWEGTDWVKYDWRDLIIYEMHIRDMTIHNSSEAKEPGTYHGLIEKNIKGGINYIKSLGVNAIEILPAMEFANIEIPYKKDSMLGRINTWNPYERNHWGYMTAAFFAPEGYYAEDSKERKWDVWEGKSGRQVTHFKDMVKVFHKEGIAVIMDVVYNHLSEYELGNLKEIDDDYYFRKDEKGNFKSESGCGNDLNTVRPMVRRMIIESLKHWMIEYKIDGFRFDLGKLIDWITLEEIIYELRKINPEVILIAEPWGGGYDPMGFSMRGYASWNDQIRNGIKGENPYNGLGWIFGKWYGNNDNERIKSYVNGTLIKDRYGLFQKKEHSVNYLESHDGFTLGDFIRIATGYFKNDDVIKDVDKFVELNELQLKLNKLAALFLFTSQGITMIHSGQEFARTKVIPYNINIPDTNKGKISHDSYSKDNETNYINYFHSETNRELLEYYKGLISLRKYYDAFRHAEYDSIVFHSTEPNEFAIVYSIFHRRERFLIAMNANPKENMKINLPDGNWEVLVDPFSSGITAKGTVMNDLIIPSTSGFVLKKKL